LGCNGQTFVSLIWDRANKIFLRLVSSSVLSALWMVIKWYSFSDKLLLLRMVDFDSAISLLKSTASYMTSPTLNTFSLMFSLFRFTTAVSVGQNKYSETWSVIILFISSGIFLLKLLNPASI